MADADVGVERLSAKVDAERKGATRTERGGGDREDGEGREGKRVEGRKKKQLLDDFLDPLETGSKLSLFN